VTTQQLLALLAVLALAALAALASIVAWSLVRRRRSAGSAKLANTLHLNARWWKDEGKKDGELLYVALGDSAAQGVGASKPGHSYVGIIARHLRDRTGRTVRVVNLSMSGARLQEALAIQLPALRRLRPPPDVLTVAIGANDIASFDRGRFERELRELYAALPAGAIVADLPSFYLGSAERNAREANAIVRRLAAERGFEIAALHTATRRQGAARYALNQVAADFFHPNDRGYRVWASAFIPLLDRVVAENRSTADAD
jgi:lysophospholipase L1-like esterase